MKRSGPIQSDPAKTRAWQARGAKKYADRQRKEPQIQSGNAQLERKGRGRSTKKRRNDSGWRKEVMELHGEVCARCGDTNHVQADHLWPRGQGGPSHVMNGLPLCGEFSRNTPGGCHPQKTASTIVIEPEWLLPEQIAWLAEVDWVAWDEDGQPHGRGWKHFGERTARSREEKGGTHGTGQE